MQGTILDTKYKDKDIQTGLWVSWKKHSMV